jgi:hypothetical protein
MNELVSVLLVSYEYDKTMYRRASLSFSVVSAGISRLLCECYLCRPYYAFQLQGILLFHCIVETSRMPLLCQ